MQMPDDFYEIRLCPHCGLRYPLIKGHPFGERCPQCLGETKPIFEYSLSREKVSDESKLPSDIYLSVLLDNIRSAWNVGSILRSADGFEFRHAYLCGITPTPENEEIRKTALGAEDSVTWSVHKDAVKLIRGLKAEGWTVFVLEKTENSRSLNNREKSAKGTVLVVGNEVTGVDPGILELADEVVHIPMHGQKRSFNVAIAFAVAAQIIRSRH